MQSVKSRISVVQDDITKIKADAIVNAANNSLSGGGGVDGAIHKAGGKEILKECIEYVSQHGPLSTGNVMMTSGGNLPSKFIIHTAGPVWKGGHSNEEKQLCNSYLNALKMAEEKGLQTIAFPNISTGIYHFPKRLAAAIAYNTVTKFLETNNTIEKVCFVCFDKENFLLYKSFLEV